jgi:hypothetical protein
MLSKKVTKSLLKKSQKAVTVTYICRLFMDKSFIKVLQKPSQNTRHKIVTTGRGGLGSKGLCDISYKKGHFFNILYGRLTATKVSLQLWPVHP